MLKWNLGFSIKTKLYFIAALTVTSFVLIAVFSFYSNQKISALQNLSTQVESARATMLLLRRNEKDFLARLDSKYLDKFTANSDKLITQVEIIDDGLIAQGLDFHDEILALEESIVGYRRSFEEIYQLHENIGLNPESGLRGQLREAVKGAEAVLKESVWKPDLHAAMLMLRRNEKDFIIRKDEKYIAKHTANTEVFYDLLNQSDLTAELKATLSKGVGDYQSGFLALTEAYKERGLNSKEGKLGEMRGTIHQSEEIFESLSTQLQNVIQQASEKTNTMFVIALVIVSALCSLSLLFLARFIASRLDQFNGLMKDIAEGHGDLSVKLEVNGKDELCELGGYFNQFVENLRGIFVRTRDISTELVTAADQSAAGTRESSDSVNQQQSQSEMVATAVTEMLATSQEITQNIFSTAEAAKSAQDYALRGSQISDETSSTITQLQQSIEASMGVLNELKDNSQEIGKVLDVIRGIAEQTNLLALNAAIEAARAGESGRGFAVVADEVRALAQRTQGSTDDIQALIERLQSGVDNSVSSMSKSMGDASIGVDKSKSCADSLREIVASVEQIFDMTTQISAASEQQSATSEEISRNTTTISDLANQAAAAVSQSAAESMNVSQLAQELDSLVGGYRT